MISVAFQPIELERLECPKCKNREGIKDGSLTLRRYRAYDIMHDCFGLHRCPKCSFKAGRAQFTKAPPTQN
jgi:hypothetical protein